MTDAERSELAALEGRLMRRALTADEERRLCQLREAQKAASCFSVVYDECVPFDEKLLAKLWARIEPNRITDAKVARHAPMLPPPADEWEEETE